jgi:hypothetical protein
MHESEQDWPKAALRTTDTKKPAVKLHTTFHIKSDKIESLNEPIFVKNSILNKNMKWHTWLYL